MQAKALILVLRWLPGYCAVDFQIVERTHNRSDQRNQQSHDYIAGIAEEESDVGKVVHFAFGHLTLMECSKAFRLAQGTFVQIVFLETTGNIQITVKYVSILYAPIAPERL